jgi:hypothetical protein
MRCGPRILVTLAVVCAAILVESPALAQSPAASAAAAPDRGGSRLFQRFVEDAGIVPGGWIEGQYSYQNLPDGTLHSVGPVIAFRLTDDVEAGLRFAYERLATHNGPDGSGFSDIDLYAKYRLPVGATPRFALGAIVKAPTADKDKGLGTGSTDVELFGALRSDLPNVTLVANAGVRLAGGADPPMPETKDSILLGGGVLLPVSPDFTFSIEGSYESRRFAGTHADGRLTLGVQTFARGGRGGFRGAVGIPLTDGAPDIQIIAGAFVVY